MRLLDLGAVSWGHQVSPSERLTDDDIELILTPHWAPATVMPRLLALLTAEERSALARNAKPEMRDRAIVSRAVLRLLLAQHLARAPALLEITTETQGKPVMRNDDGRGRAIAFNVSHTEDLLLFGFARAPVGVDIEQIAPIPDLDAFARLVLSPRERAACAELSAEGRLDHVYRVWVAKEALAKRSGEGLGRDVPKIDLSSQQDQPDTGVTLFTPQDGFIAAFAGAVRAVPRFRRISDLTALLDG